MSTEFSTVSLKRTGIWSNIMTRLPHDFEADTSHAIEDLMSAYDALLVARSFCEDYGYYDACAFISRALHQINLADRDLSGRYLEYVNACIAQDPCNHAYALGLLDDDGNVLPCTHGADQESETDCDATG